MKSTLSLIAMATMSVVCAGVSAQSPSYTDVAPYTDLGGRVPIGEMREWKGQLSRAEVTDALLQARSAGTIAVGDAVGYPQVMKVSPPTVQTAQPRAPTQVLGGPSQEVSGDGYRFVGGEAGYIYIGQPHR